MANSRDGTTASGNLKHAHYTTVCKWILDAWNSISPEIIQKSFLKSSISNAFDRTEDDYIYESNEDLEESIYNYESNLTDKNDFDDDDEIVVEDIFSNSYEVENE